MASIEQIQVLFREWEKLSTLSVLEAHVVTSMRQVADKGNMQEFEIFKNSMCGQFWKVIYSAIVKAREAGINA